MDDLTALAGYSAQNAEQAGSGAMKGSGRSEARRDPASLRKRQDAPVSLRIAASLVYFELNQTVAARNDVELDRALNDAALALAQVADIYHEDEGRVARIPHDELRSGRFEGGAKTFRSSAGNTFRSLFVRRLDIMHAMAILEQASRALKANPDGRSKLRKGPGG